MAVTSCAGPGGVSPVPAATWVFSVQGAAGVPCSGEKEFTRENRQIGCWINTVPRVLAVHSAPAARASAASQQKRQIWVN